MLMGGTLRNFCTDVLLRVLVDGVLVCGVWVWAGTLLGCGRTGPHAVGCVVVVSFHCHGSRSLCWGWWFGCVVVVCFVNSGREHLAITLCVVVVILFVFVFLVLFVLSPHCMCRLSGLCVPVWGGECSRAHGGCLGIKSR